MQSTKSSTRRGSSAGHLAPPGSKTRLVIGLSAALIVLLLVGLAERWSTLEAWSAQEARFNALVAASEATTTHLAQLSKTQPEGQQLRLIAGKMSDLKEALEQIQPPLPLLDAMSQRVSQELELVKRTHLPSPEEVAMLVSAHGDLRDALDAYQRQLTAERSAVGQLGVQLIIGACLLCLLLMGLVLWVAYVERRAQRLEVRRELSSKATQDGLWEWDFTLNKVEFSSRWRVIAGLSEDQLTSKPDEWMQRLHPADREGFEGAIQAHITGQTAILEHEHRLRHGDGRYRWVSVRGVAQVGRQPGRELLAGSMRDVTSVKQAVQSEAETDMLRAVLNNVESSLGILSLERGFESYASGLKELLSQWDDPTEWWGDIRKILRLPETVICKRCGQPEIRGTVTATLRGPHGRRESFELVFAGHAHLPDRSPFDHAVLVRRVTSAERASDKRPRSERGGGRSTGSFDQLTGLPDRTAFSRAVIQVIEECEADERFDFVLLVVDLDNLGLLNDTLGSEAGDRMLRITTHRIERALGSRDVLARIGSDEFGMVLRGMSDVDELRHFITSLQAAMSDPVDFDGQEVVPSVTVGAALSHRSYSGEALIRAAESARRRASKRGQSAVEVVESPLERGPRKTLRLTTDLRRALARDELLLLYQPLVSLKDPAHISFEALIRWQHPEFGLVSPGDFIPMAELTGAIVPVGRWVLATAAAQAKAWQRAFPDRADRLMLSVNISARQFQETDLVDFFKGLTQESALTPGQLKLELTESALMEHPEQANETLYALKALGLSLWVDDFGTGYSSLSYLRRFPIDGLKIDRSFVSPPSSTEDLRKIVLSVIELGHSLDLQVVAEGVETEDQLEFVTTHGCDLAQGYYFSRPVSADSATELIRVWDERF